MAKLISRRHTLGLPLALAAGAYISHSTEAEAATSTTTNEEDIPATRFYPGPDGVVGAATSRGYDVLSVRTPSGDGRWWSGDNVNYLTDTIQDERTKHGIALDQLWLVGYSGGSEFITQSFFPEYAESMKAGGFLVFGGGNAPKDQTGVSFSAQARSTFSLNWVTGKWDSSKDYDALGNAQKGLAFYSSAPDVAFSHTWSDWPDRTNHEDITKQFGLYVGIVLDRYQ